MGTKLKWIVLGASLLFLILVVFLSKGDFQKGAFIKLNPRVSQKSAPENFIKLSVVKQPPKFFQLNPDATLPEKNAEVISLSQLYSSQNIEYTTLETSLKQRRDKIATLMRENPTKVSEYALQSNVINALPSELRQYVEQSKSVEGVLQTSHFDNFASQENSFNHSLLTSDKKIIPIYSSENLVDFSGRKIIASGLLLDGAGIAAKNVEYVSKAAYLRKNTPPRLLVIPLAFYGADSNNLSLSPPQNIPEQDLRKIIFDGQDSVKGFFKKNSGGTIDFTGDILQTPLELSDSKFAQFPIVQFFSYDDFHVLMKKVDSQIDFSKYDYYQFIPLNNRTTSISQCVGLGSEGPMIFDTDEGQLTAGISIINVNCFYFSPQTFKHEIGHNLGLNHANGWGCIPDGLTSQFYQGIRKDISLDPDPDLKASEGCINVYGDDSVMGGGVVNLNPAQRKKIGDTFTSKIITESGNYLLDVAIHDQVGNFIQNNQALIYPNNLEIPLRDNRSIVKDVGGYDFAKEIKQPDTKDNSHYKELIIPAANGYYSLEYRIMGAKKGVAIWFVRNDMDSWPYSERLRSDTLRIGGGGYDKNSKKILDSFFGINTTFEDALRGINVSILKLDNSVATVQVSID